MTKKNNNNNDEVAVWNVSKDYSKLKIMNPLEKLDENVIIAKTGFKNNDEEINSNLSKDQINYRKYVALKHLASDLSTLFNNSDFSIKNKKKEFQNYFKVLKNIESKYIPKKVAKLTGKDRAILLKLFVPILNLLIEIKKRVNIPLNENNLIYLNKKEYDPLERKKDSLDRVANI